MNGKKVPQLFAASGATKWGDPQRFPWTMGWQPNYQSEGRIYAKYIREHYPNGKIAALWQNDDAGKDQMKGTRDGLGDKANMIIADAYTAGAFRRQQQPVAGFAVLAYFHKREIMVTLPATQTPSRPTVAVSIAIDGDAISRPDRPKARRHPRWRHVSNPVPSTEGAAPNSDLPEIVPCP
jgi:hypothetical protein